LPVFVIDVARPSPDHVVATLRGELAGEVWDQVRTSLDDPYLDDGVRRIEIRLDALEFLDLEGVGVLVQLHREAEQRGKELVVEGARGSVRRKLETTGVLHLLSGPSTRPHGASEAGR
jgi:anti-anti-sigma factor